MNWLLISCLLGFAAAQNSLATYSVLAPKVLRPNSDYTVVVSIHGGQESTRVTVQLGGNNLGSYVNREVVEILPDTSMTLKFIIGELDKADYNLTVTGYGEINFRNTTQLQYEDKSYSIFIQTDRGVYKPSDTVKFRAVVVTPHLRPSVTGAIDVFVKDGNGNIVKQWLRVFTNKGVFSNEVALSDEPVLGQWQIIVDVLGQRTSAGVLVAEYVLPKFEVEVVLPEYVTFEDEQIVATVNARYTHGRPVKGEVTVQVSPTYKYAYLQAPYDQPISVVKQMKGKTDLTFNIFDDLRLKEDYIRELQFTAYVKEELTERVQNSTSKITIFRYPYKMQLIRTSDSFKPGLKYKAFLKIAYHDDSPVREGTVLVRHAFSTNRKDYIETTHPVTPNGIIPLEFYPPLDEKILNLAIEAKFDNMTQWLADLRRAQSPSNSFLQATLLSDNPKVGEEVEVGLNSTDEMLYFTFEILGRGDILFAQTMQVRERNKREFKFKFIASLAMAPRSRLVAYYVRDDGEVVADSLHFNVEGAIQNDVTVSVNPRTVDAGQNVAITVTTKPNAYVGISAIDQSSLLLSEGNQLTEDGILNELDSYDPGRIDTPAPWQFLGSRSRRSLLSWHGTTTAAEVFDSSGVVFMTNGVVPSFDPFVGGVIPIGQGPIDGSNLNTQKLPPAVNGPFYREIAHRDSVTVKPDLGPGVAYNGPTRPPLAGPYAFSYLPPPPDHKPRIYLNKALPAPWLFLDARTRSNGVVTLREKAPDTISSYVISAFAVDDFYGLGVTQIPRKLTIFRPFFVSLYVPSPVKKGEAVAVEAVVFNYGDRPVTATVTLFNPGPGDFLFPDFVNEIDQGSPESSRNRTVEIAPDSGTPVSFMIVPQKLGAIDIRISARSQFAVDNVRKQLIVKPEGTTITVNKALMIDLNNEKSFSERVNITTPQNIVEDSLDVSVSVIGDIIGPAVEDPEKLLQIPTGCGEQNLAKLMPNLLLMDYLDKSESLRENFKDRAMRNLELGYQRQLTYRHSDGSFSAFGEKDNNGSTWLTAFVVRSLPQLMTYIDVESHILDEAVVWLINNQELDGGFLEKGKINNEALQGGSGNGVPLTAYVAISLLNIRISMPDKQIDGLRNSINRALEFLVTHLDQTESSYGLAITSYALQLANHPLKDSAFYQLEGKATVMDGKKWWSDDELHKTIESVVDSKSLDVETTSYALLTYTTRRLVKDSLPLLKWLTAQRNQYGGFQSTQDTIVAMKALTSILSMMPNSNPRLQVQIIRGDIGDTVVVNRNNAMVLQKSEIVQQTDSVTIKARGNGFAVVQVTYKYNVVVSGPGPSFSLDPQIDRTTDKNKLRLTACTGYTAGNMSNMAVLDVSLPTGYVVDNDLIYSLYNYEGVKKVEKKDMDSGVLVYFDNLTPYEVCPTITAYRVSKVAFQKRVPVKVYDYYDMSRSARQFYTPAPATLCDICDLGECDEGQCSEQIIQLNRQQQDPADFFYPVSIEETSSANSLTVSLILTFVFILVNL